MQAAYEKATQEIKDSFALAEQSKVCLPLPNSPYTVIAAVCDGHPSEIGDSWGKQANNTVIALFDRKHGGVSLRRSPDCDVDLSKLAQAFGGGGHPAASGCQPEELALMFAHSVAQLFSAKLQASVQAEHAAGDS